MHFTAPRWVKTSIQAAYYVIAAVAVGSAFLAKDQFPALMAILVAIHNVLDAIHSSSAPPPSTPL